MGFEPIRGDRGQPMVRCICDVCARDEVVPAVHGKGGDDGHGQAVLKVQRLGWSYIGKRLRCAGCEAKRKVEKMANKPADGVVEETALRMPTMAQKREIMDLLRDVYDIEASRYRQGDTDETVADVLGVMPGWVAEIREDWFGPAGGNEDMAALAAEFGAFLDEARAEHSELKEKMDRFIGTLAQVSALRERLVKIEAAVGKRIMARVK